MTQGRLELEVITVHCFWGWCDHVEAAIDPTVGHTLMEEHYRTHHGGDLARLGY